MLLGHLLLTRSVSKSSIFTLPSGNSILAYLESSEATQWKNNSIMMEHCLFMYLPWMVRSYF